MLNKNNKKEISAIQDLIESKIYVNPARREELRGLKEQLWALPLDQLPGGATCTLLCLNLSDKVEEALRSRLPGWTLQVERICADPDAPEYKEDRKRFVKLFSGKQLEGAGVAAIVHELRSQGEELAQLDKRVIALSLLGKLPVISCCCSSADALPAASAATGDTWPVFFTPHPHEDVRPMAEWLRDELPRVRALSAAITDEVQVRTAHLGKVNAPLHFLKRGAVALVPFGVLTVNTLGIVRLMARMLQLAGMRGDTSANKALGLLGAENAALVTAVDSLGDVYSFAIFATVLADLQGMGFVEAAEAMDVVDGLTLGSIGVVTGAVSAIGAYLSRPVMVRSAGQFLASLQTIYALNPAMRRESLERKKKKKKKRHGGRHRAAGGGPGEAGDKEELRGLLQRSAVSGKTREQARRGKKKGRKGVLARTQLEERHGAAAAALAGLSESEASDEDEAAAQSGSASEDGSEELELPNSSGAGGEEASAAASAAAVAAASAAAAAEDLAAAAEQAAATAEAEAVAAEADADGASLATTSASATQAGGAGTGKLTREEKKQLAVARRAAAAEAKAKAAEAKAAAKAAAVAAKAAEKERLALEKAAAKEAAKAAKAAAAADKAATRERRAEEKAAAKEEAKAAKAAAAAAKAAEKERLALEKAAAKEAAKAAKEEAKAAKAGGAKASEASTSSIVGPEGWQEAPAAPDAGATKLRWWQRGKKAGAAGAGAAAGAAAAGAAGCCADSDGGGSSSSGASGSDESGWGLAVLGGAVGGSAEADGGGGGGGGGGRDVTDAVARDERMGLDAETRAALAQFLSLEEEEDEVYGAEGGGGEVYGGEEEGLAAAGVAGVAGPLGSNI